MREIHKRINLPLSIISIFLLLLTFTHCHSGSDSESMDIQCHPESITAYQGEKVIMTFSIMNHMNTTIRPGIDFKISYHLYDSGGKSVSYDNPRYAIPRVLRRNKTTDFEIPLFFGHQQAGEYTVEFDIVKEGKFWGSHKGWKTCKAKLNLKPLISEEFKAQYPGNYLPTGKSYFDQEQFLLRMTYKNCEQRVKGGRLFGFAAGSNYPQVWIRDTATFIRYARQFYDVESLAFGIEGFLLHQEQEGEIVDWIDLSGKTDKNTVETDQESSLVLAAHEIAVVSPQWLDRVINGMNILDRLDLALEWVWKNKRHPKHDLILSGFTADWGDNENTFPDQRATKLSDKSTMVMGIYTQAKYIQAMEALLKLYRLKGNHSNEEKWRERLALVRQQTMKLLYMEDKGYFLIHRITEPKGDSPKWEKILKMEKEMLAVGGNAEAIIAGLMNEKQVKRFIDVLEQKRKQYELRTVSFTLLPPYPEGFFPHHLLKYPWNYQNGGEWDWIGARVVKGLYLNGFTAEADRYLTEIVKKNLTHNCIYEWEDRTGTGRGALFYVGAAGVIGDALLTRASTR